MTVACSETFRQALETAGFVPLWRHGAHDRKEVLR